MDSPQFLRVKRGWVMGRGSGTVTSKPAPAICPVDSASYRSSWFTTHLWQREHAYNTGTALSGLSSFTGNSFTCWCWWRWKYSSSWRRGSCCRSLLFLASTRNTRTESRTAAPAHRRRLRAEQRLDDVTWHKKSESKLRSKGLRLCECSKSQVNLSSPCWESVFDRKWEKAQVLLQTSTM